MSTYHEDSQILPNQVIKSETEKQDPIFSKYKLSPQNDLTLQFVTRQTNEGLYEGQVLFDSYPDTRRLIIDVDGVKTDNYALVKFEGTKDEIERMSGFSNNFLTWSNSENKFALLLPNRIEVYEYSISEISDDDWIPKRSMAYVTKIKEFQIDKPYNRYGYPVILFSGNGKELFYYNTDGIKMLLPEEKIVKTSEEYGSSIYPIPNSGGVAYWTQAEEEESSHSSHYFVLNSGIKSKKYRITSDTPMDYMKEIILSPNLQRVCVGWETSGGGGRTVFDLNSEREIKAGEGCIQWLSNNEIVVFESDYQGFGEYGNLVYYSVNLITGKRTWLHSYQDSF